MATEYGQRLKKARLHAGLTQLELAAKTGIAQSTISTAERLGNGSSDTTVYAQACGVDPHWLATGQGEMIKSVENTPQAQSISAVKAITFEDAIRVIAERLMSVDQATARRAMSVLSDLAEDPADHGRLARATNAVLETGKRRAA